MKSNIPEPIRRRRRKQSHQRLRPIKENPLTDPLQVLKDRLKGQNSKPHGGRREGRHSDIGADIDDNSGSATGFHLLQELLYRNGDVGFSEGLALEHSGDVLVGLFGEGSEIGEGVEEGVFDAFDEAGEDGGGLGAFVAVEGLDSRGWG